MQFTFAETNASVALSGDLTFPDHPAFRDMTGKLLNASRDTLVIDVAKLSFIDSAGLGMLLIAREQAARANRKLVLRGPSGQVKRMFDISKFETVFTIES